MNWVFSAFSLRQSSSPRYQWCSTGAGRLMLMFKLILQIYLLAKSCYMRHESSLQLSPELFRLQGRRFQGWRYRVPAHRSRNCKSTRTKCSSSYTWKIQIALGCSLHVTTSCDGWERHTEWPMLTHRSPSSSCRVACRQRMSERRRGDSVQSTPH